MASGGMFRNVRQSFDAPGDAPKYLKDALKDIGITEYVLEGRTKVSNPVVQRYVAKALGQDRWNGNTMDVPWCAFFVNAKLEYAGIPGTKSGMARSFGKWGQPVDEEDWHVGDIPYFWRGSKDDHVTGHVGFLLDWDAKTVTVLGGNQSDRVCIQKFDRRKLIGVRRPRGITKSRTIRANAGAATTEAAAVLIDKSTPSQMDALVDAAKAAKEPLHQLSTLDLLVTYKPFIVGVLTAISIALIIYGLWTRYSDHKEGYNS